MIAQIHSKGSNPYFVLRYLCQKVDARISSCNQSLALTPGSGVNPNALTDVLLESAIYNPKVKNKYAHISINLPANENLSDDQFLTLARKYLEEMGYSDCPNVIFRHFDAHPHIHIVVSTVDFSGNWVDDSKDFLRSFKIARKLEQEFHLSPPPSTNIAKYTTNEKNAHLFSFRNSFARALKTKHGASFIENALGKDNPNINRILYKRNISNSQAKEILGEETFTYISNFLYEKKFFNKEIKDDLTEKIKAVHDKSRTFDDFILNCSKENIYLRILSKEGIPGITYGIPELNFYMKESQLPFDFSYKQLVKNKGKQTKLTYSRYDFKRVFQQDYYNCLENSYSLKDLKKNLQELGYSAEVEQVGKGARISITAADCPHRFYDNELSKAYTLEKFIFPDTKVNFYGALRESNSIASLTQNLRKRGYDLIIPRGTDQQALVKNISSNVSHSLTEINPSFTINTLTHRFNNQMKFESPYVGHNLKSITFQDNPKPKTREQRPLKKPFDRNDFDKTNFYNE